MDNELISQHKRLAMGLPVNNEPAGANKNMVNDMVTKHASYGIIKNTTGKDDAPAKSSLKAFDGRK